VTGRILPCCVLSAPADNTLWVVAVDGTHRPRAVVAHDDVAFPSWSPDGRTIYASGQKFGGLFTVAYPSGAETRDFQTGGTRTVVSPDGSRLAFILPSSPPFENAVGPIWTAATDGTSLRLVTTTLLAGTLDWQPFRPAPAR